ncbi:MAG: ImmA/IrrE family metallo-endopeptidase, partial [Paracoccaceae bacterium]
VRTETKHRSADFFDYIEPDDPKKEAEANAFAAALLMPPNLFKPAFARFSGDIKKLSTLFDVSEATVCRRVRELALRN